ncbi:MAG: hypothetical protein KBD78_03305 [Oligoflexales bacterium]|nr:hypothetical protein [Oligoflexales bacterium]
MNSQYKIKTDHIINSCLFITIFLVMSACSQTEIIQPTNSDLNYVTKGKLCDFAHSGNWNAYFFYGSNMDNGGGASWESKGRIIAVGCFKTPESLLDLNAEAHAEFDIKQNLPKYSDGITEVWGLQEHFSVYFQTHHEFKSHCNENLISNNLKGYVSADDVAKFYLEDKNIQTVKMSEGAVGVAFDTDAVTGTSCHKKITLKYANEKGDAKTALKICKSGFKIQNLKCEPEPESTETVN